MADTVQPTEEDALSGEQPPAHPTQVRVWAWVGETIAPFAYQWPGDDRRLRQLLANHRFDLEFRAGTEHYPLATVYSHVQDAPTESLPQQYLVVIHFASHYELILAEHLPALLQVLRYLDPVINR
jgi:hypothetical protein